MNTSGSSAASTKDLGWLVSCYLLFAAQSAAAWEAYAKEGACSDGVTVHRVVGHRIYGRTVLHATRTGRDILLYLLYYVYIKTRPSHCCCWQ